MADNTNLEISGRRPCVRVHAVRGLVYYRSLGSVSRWNLVEPIALQNDEAGGELERIPGFPVLLQVPVKVRSGKYHYKRRRGILLSEPPNRIGALAGVQRYEQVAGFIRVTLRDTDAVT